MYPFFPPMWYLGSTYKKQPLNVLTAYGLPCCPKSTDGFVYTILPNDTLSKIAVRFDIGIEDILKANPFLNNMNLLYPGQRICIPKPSMKLPFSIILKADPGLELQESPLGSVLIKNESNNKYSLTYSGVNLPHPLTLGNYNRYAGTLSIGRTSTIYNSILNRVVQEGQPEIWCGSTIVPFDPSSQGSELTIRAYNVETGASGPVIVRFIMPNHR